MGDDWMDPLKERLREIKLGIAHRDDIPWFEAPLPHRWHRCRSWTSMRPPDKLHTILSRCACGAVSLDNGPWVTRNSRRGARGRR